MATVADASLLDQLTSTNRHKEILRNIMENTQPESRSQ